MHLFGFSKLEELRRQLSTLSQLAGVERMVIGEGGGRGNEVLRLRTGAGLALEVLVSRGFDLGLCEIMGLPVSWRSALGHVSPSAYDPRGREWNRGFGGGLMTTCGLGHAGRSEVVGGTEFGLHGRLSFLPAVLEACMLEESPTPAILLKAHVREAMVGGDQLMLHRTIRLPLFENIIQLHDCVVNEGCTEAVHMMLYHVNLGFPLIGPSTRFAPVDGTHELVSGHAKPENYRRLCDPDDQDPSVILHRPIPDGSGRVSLSLSNEVPAYGGRVRLSVSVRYLAAQCPYLSEWRHFAPGMNVLALEPGNVSTKGMGFHREDGTLCRLKPGESRQYDVEFAVEGKIIEA